MKYFAALPLAASFAAAQMQVMSVASAAPSGPVTHTVVVGGVKPVATGVAAVLGYSPESIQAAVGDVVSFQFMQKNHTVTQSSFADPCKKLDGGIDSGFMPNPNGDPGVTFNVTVNSTDPTWFYCKQKTGTHCGKGMVFAINAVESGDKTFEIFKQAAISINGTGPASLTSAGLQQATPNAQAAPTTVTVLAGGASATNAAASAASVVAGSGTDGSGQACACQCLCGMNAFPASAAVNNFGGFPGQIGA